MTEDHLKCLQALKTSTYEQFKDVNPDRMQGTCQWVLSHPQYLQWARSDEDSLLWISADPGCGKSVLAKSLVDHELRTTNEHTVCYFFFKDNEQQDNLATALCALLHQLFCHQPRLIQYAIPAWQANGNNLVREVAELWRTLLATSTAHETQDVTCVLDALDECRQPDRLTLFNMLAKFSSQPPPASSTARRGRLKFIITSRPYFEVVKGFQLNARHRPLFHIAAEKEDASLSSDVQRYVRGRLAATDLVGEEVDAFEAKLNLSHQHNFLCAFLLTEDLVNEPLGTMEENLALLDHLPKSMEEQYERILSRCKKPENAKNILSLIVAARSPLTLEEIDVILSFQLNPRPWQNIILRGCDRVLDTIRDTCGLFVRVVDGKLYLLHETAKRFLLKHFYFVSDQNSTKCWRSSIDLAASHSTLAWVCTTFMKMRPRPDLAPFSTFLEYAVQNLGYHAIEAFQSAEESMQKQQIQRMIGWGLDMQMVDPDGRSLLQQVLHVGSGTLEQIQLILNHGGLVKTADRENMNCLHYAALNYKTMVIQTLADAGFDVNACVIRGNPRAFGSASAESKASSDSGIKRGLTALHAAAYFGRSKTLHMLLQKGAQVNFQNETGQTALHLALGLSIDGTEWPDIWNDDVYLVGQIWDFDDEAEVEETISYAHEERQSVLHMLCDHADIDISIKDHRGRTALHMVRYKEYASEVGTTQYLIEHGADRLAQDQDGVAPIHMAARAGDLPSLQVLVESPNDVMLEDSRGCNALLYAAQSGSADAVQFLIDTCTDSPVCPSTDHQGRNALHHCLYDEKYFTHPNLEIIRVLVEGGVDACHQDHDGLDTLAWYTSKRFRSADVDIMEVLISCGTNVNYQDQSGRNLAHLVVRRHVGFDLDVLALLIKYGVDVLSVDHDGRGILHHAAISGLVTVELLSYLSESLHLNIASLDSFGKSALECATDEERKNANNVNNARRHPIFRGNRWRDTKAAFLQYTRGHPQTDEI